MPTPTTIWKGYTGALVETPRSKAFAFGERITYSEELSGQYADVFGYANAHYRGTVWTIPFPGGSGTFYVEDSKLIPDEKTGDKATVQVNYCFVGSVPPDEFAMPPFEIGPPVEKNSFFSTLTQDDLKKARAAFNAASASGQTSFTTAIAGTTNATLTTSLINKWLRGEETFYLAGFKFQWTSYSVSMPTVTRGGVIAAPTGPFSGIVPGGLAWLRQADEPSWNNGIWKLTRTWVGAPGGWWDADLYA